MDSVCDIWLNQFKHKSDQDIMGMSRSEITVKPVLDVWVGVTLLWHYENVT